MICREIPIEHIDFNDETYRISEEISSAPLVESIRRIGQLNPVILLKSNMYYRTVCGFRRLHALRQLNAKQVLARILDKKAQDSPGIFELAIWDNLSHRPLEPLEKARILYKLVNHFQVPRRTLARIYLPSIDLKPHEQVLQSYLALHESHPEFRKYFRDGRLTQKSMEYLSMLASPSREIIASSLEKIRLSASLQKKFFGLLQELAVINGTEPGNTLEHPRILEILANTRLSPAQRGESIYSMLYRFRYPRLSQAEKIFLDRIRSLGLPGPIRIKATPYFEKPDLSVEFSARNAEHFRKLAGELYEASRSPELERLFRGD